MKRRPNTHKSTPEHTRLQQMAFVDKSPLPASRRAEPIRLAKTFVGEFPQVWLSSQTASCWLQVLLPWPPRAAPHDDAEPPPKRTHARCLMILDCTPRLLGPPFACAPPQPSESELAFLRLALLRIESGNPRYGGALGALRSSERRRLHVFVRRAWLLRARQGLGGSPGSRSERKRGHHRSRLYPWQRRTDPGLLPLFRGLCSEKPRTRARSHPNRWTWLPHRALAVPSGPPSTAPGSGSRKSCAGVAAAQLLPPPPSLLPHLLLQPCLLDLS
mmetsp:Transcript_12077/g.34927  ORF Transcript_12077/g.34927 Transcript_12077/m.34927 type:complete len:273 (-) Transcript_12077:67-885(-)